MKNKQNRFNIDFFEFSFLVEACIPPVPIARYSFFSDVINKYYHVLTPNERKRLYEWIGRSPRMTESTDDMCMAFLARYNPDNQYRVTVSRDLQTETNECFLMDGVYYTYYDSGKKIYAAGEYITNVEKIL
jgi:hypothetical protein